ncbi:MAG: hypothetical protein ACE5OV_04065 [Candidatus Bathyarchaeia archaeon]
MRKIVAMLLGFVLTMSISMAVVKPAQAYPLSSFTWVPPHVMRGYYGDPYYDYIVAYENGSTVQLLLPVKNDVYANGLNVSRVIISFYEIGVNKTLDYSASPHKIASGNYELFTVSFLANLTEFGSSTWDHVYQIIVEHVNATNHLVGSYTRYWNSISPGYKFVVISNAQVDAMDSLAKYTAYYNQYSGYSWQSIDAQQKATQAILAKTLGDSYYQLGDYTSATTKYNNAVTLWEEAIAAEGVFRTSSDAASYNKTLSEAAKNLKEADAALITANATKTQADAALITANATKTQADAALTNAYGWYFIGIGFAIGWTLMGIGVIIYALKKPKPPT